jgi:hypothetical protein
VWLFVQFGQYIEQKITYQCGWGFIMANTTRKNLHAKKSQKAFQLVLKHYNYAMNRLNQGH